MKCNNPNHSLNCKGEMKPLPGSPSFIECNKCGYRTNSEATTEQPGEPIAEGSTPVKSKKSTT